MGEISVHFRLIVENMKKLCEKGCILTFFGSKSAVHCELVIR